MEGSRSAGARLASVRWTNRERSNGRDFYSSACSDLLRAGRWRLKALDAGAGENENDNDPAFLTARRREYPPHTPHRYLVAARAAHRSQRGRSAVRVRSPYSRCPKNSIRVAQHAGITPCPFASSQNLSTPT